MPLVYLLTTHWDTSSPTGTCGPCIRGPVRICPMPIGLHRNEWFSLGHCCSTWAILFVWRDGCGIMPMIHLIQCHVLPFLPFFCYLILGPFTRFACGWYTFVAFVIFCVFFWFFNDFMYFALCFWFFLSLPSFTLKGKIQSVPNVSSYILGFLVKNNERETTWCGFMVSWSNSIWKV